MASRSRNWLTALVIAPVAVLAVALGGTGEAGAVSETISNGQIEVTIEPTEGLADGQELTITVVAKEGANLNEVRANQCVAPVDNNFSHSRIGGFCLTNRMSPNSETALGENNPEKISGPFAPGTTETQFTYRVGVGEQVANDEVTGDSRTVRCGPAVNDADTCYLDLWIQQSLNPEVHYAVPLRFGTAAPVTTTTGPAGGTTTPGTVPGTTIGTMAPSPDTTVSDTVPDGDLSGGPGSGGSGAGSLPVTGTTLALAGLGSLLVAAGGAVLAARRSANR